MVPANTYQTSVVAYLDIIGMKEAVRRSVEEPQLAGRLEGMLSEIESRCVELTKRWRGRHPIRARAFSDSVILTCPGGSDHALRKMAVYVSAFQMLVAVRGFFIRGAITVGPHCDRRDICFGPALAAAYEAERQLPNWPRVVLLPESLKSSRGYSPYLRRDNAGVTYVNYLLLSTASVLLQSNVHQERQAGLHTLSWISLIEGHKRSLEEAVKRLNADSPEFLVTLSRYHSLAHYHNWYLRQLMRADKKLDENFPWSTVLELILCDQKGMTEERLAEHLAYANDLISEIDEMLRGRLRNCLIDTGIVFAPLRSRGARTCS